MRLADEAFVSIPTDLLVELILACALLVVGAYKSADVLQPIAMEDSFNHRKATSVHQRGAFASLHHRGRRIA